MKCRLSDADCHCPQRDRARRKQGRISCPNRQVCDRLHGGPTAKRHVAFLRSENDPIGPYRPRRQSRFETAFGGVSAALFGEAMEGPICDSRALSASPETDQMASAKPPDKVGAVTVNRTQTYEGPDPQSAQLYMTGDRFGSQSASPALIWSPSYSSDSGHQGGLFTPRPVLLWQQKEKTVLFPLLDERG